MTMLDVIWLIPAFPLAGFLIILVAGRRLGDPRSGYLATAMVALSFVVSIGAYFDLLSRSEEDRAHIETLFSWVPVDSLQIDMAFLADPLSITMCLFVTGIAMLIHLFAIGYMHGDPKFSKFFLYLNLFVLSMTVLVLGENLLVTFLGWEGVGTCSYLLISFWHTRDSAATAGKKAFITNRIGDWGVMLAMFLSFSAVGSVSYSVLNNNAEGGTLAQSTATGIAALLFVGAIGKSAQLPLYVWLPDAMEGPTPVSALIHAATMVTAGVFLLVRVNPVITVAADWIGPMIAWVGAITALFAATIALAQTDIKKVLAYSTVSQLGYMFLAVGTGAYVAAIFHMVTHAFFKALLFLGSGSVIHGMHDEQDMRKMGKLLQVHADHRVHVHHRLAGDRRRPAVRRVLVERRDPAVRPRRERAAVRDRHRHRDPHGVLHDPPGGHDLLRRGEVGEPRQPRRSPEGEEHLTHGAHGEFKPHESPAVMLLPLVALAGLSIVGGIIQLPSLGIIPKSWQHKLEDWLHPVVAFGEAEITDTWAYDNKVLLIAIAIACAVVGIVAAYFVYQRRAVKAFEPQLLADGWKYDQAISWFMGNPGRAGFQAVADFDEKVVDGAVNGAATGVTAVASEARKGQTGYVRNYAGWIGIGVVLLLGWFVVIRGVL